jgi:hypothetical protein
MSKGDFFSGLVQGLGGSMAQMHQQKMQKDYQDRMTELQIMLSAAKDENMPNLARRELLRKGLGNFNKKFANLADLIVPQYEVETGKKINGMTEETDTDEPTFNPGQVVGPASGSSQRQGPLVTSDSSMPPPLYGQGQDRNTILAGGDQSEIPGQPDPNRLPQPGLPGMGMEGSAPVTQAMTGGSAVNPTQAEVAVEQARKMLRIMPARPQMLSSDQLSPAQIGQYNQEKSLRRELDLREQASQSSRMWEMQNVTVPLLRINQQIGNENMQKEIAVRLAAIPMEQRAKMLATISSQMEAAKAAGLTLSPMDLKQILGISPDPVETAQRMRVQLERDLQSEDPLVKQAAMRQIEQSDLSTLDSKLGIMYKREQILKMQRGDESDIANKERTFNLEGLRRAQAILANPDLIEKRAQEIYQSMDPVEKLSGGMAKARAAAANELKVNMQGVAAQIALALQVGKHPVTIGEALRMYNEAPGRKTKAFTQVLADLYNDPNTVVIDDGTPVAGGGLSGAGVEGSATPRQSQKGKSRSIAARVDSLP